jgi:hypothetical protein
MHPAARLPVMDSCPPPLAEGARDSLGGQVCGLCSRPVRRGEREAVLCQTGEPVHVGCITWYRREGWL